RLIDDKIDVTSIHKSLLDPSFDLQAWLRGRDLVKKPPPPPSLTGAEQGEVKPSAFVRGTQFVDLGGAAAALRAMVQAPKADAAPMLTIGLPKAATAFVQITAPTAYLEAGGHRWPLTAQVTSIGCDPKCEVPLNDPQVSHVHAQITLHNEDHYLRDLGSRSGTWVNGNTVTVPHRLRHGDEIRVGGTSLRFLKEGVTRASSLPAAPPAPPPELHLEVRAGPRLGLRFALSSSSITIGRDDANGVRIDDLSVSRRHAVLNQHGQSWYICDLHSSRGTLKNGVRLTPGQEVAIVEGEQIQLGDVVLALCR
ncbi:MAG TPA: FHA domain-containing protein, partial [Polyangiaceae bacterium]|nr:FHA domain-containing protein [Polyangiaceae bacterium]